VLTSESGTDASMRPAVGASLMRLASGSAEVRRRPGPCTDVLMQLTSGTTGAAKPLTVREDNLQANLAAIHRWLEWSRDDNMVSWLPLNHDIGRLASLRIRIRCPADCS
jgi:acyl-CoA synthetase (AMP-forming)/AMP-acid ligase II